MENKTLTPELERYNSEMKRWEEINEQTKPKESDFDSKEKYESAYLNWSFERHMDEPNKPGYFRANND